MSASEMPPVVSGEITAVFGRVEPPRLEEAAPVVVLSAEDAAAVNALPRGSALLIVQRGGIPGERFLLDSSRALAGRTHKSHVFLDDVTVSRKHAEFLRDGDQFSVHDVGSLNGTYVNRERIDEAQLRAGDEVQIGKFRMLFQVSPHTTPSHDTPTAFAAA